MQFSVHPLADYFAKSHLSLFDIFAPTIVPGGKQQNWHTNQNGAGFVFSLYGSSGYTLNDMPYVLKSGVILHAEPILITKISEQFGLERHRFSYLFEKYTGMSPSN